MKKKGDEKREKNKELHKTAVTKKQSDENLTISEELFRLFSETGVDGERIARERAEAEEARRTADAAQVSLFSNLQPARP